jgi:hypothetical protein
MDISKTKPNPIFLIYNYGLLEFLEVPTNREGTSIVGTFTKEGKPNRVINQC